MVRDVYDEIQEFHVLELRIKTNPYVPRSFLAQSSNEKAGLNRDSNLQKNFKENTHSFPLGKI